MPIFSISIDPSLVPDDEIPAVLQELQSQGFRPELDELAPIMASYERMNFETQGNTFGDPWAALKPATIRQKMRAGFPETPMVRTGLLQSEVGEAVDIEGNDITVGIDLDTVPYAKYHQPEALGGTNTGTGNLPARILIATSGQEETELADTLKTSIAERLGIDPEAVTINIEPD